jgi:hypothetical protein
LVPWFPRHIFDAHTTGFTVFVWRGNAMTSAAAVDEFVDRHQWMDRSETEGSLGYLLEEGVYQVPIALAER